MLLPAFVSFKRLQVNIVCVNSNELLRFIPFYSLIMVCLQTQACDTLSGMLYVEGRGRPKQLEVQAG